MRTNAFSDIITRSEPPEAQPWQECNLKLSRIEEPATAGGLNTDGGEEELERERAAEEVERQRAEEEARVELMMIIQAFFLEKRGKL